MATFIFALQDKRVLRGHPSKPPPHSTGQGTGRSDPTGAVRQRTQSSDAARSIVVVSSCLPPEDPISDWLPQKDILPLYLRLTCPQRQPPPRECSRPVRLMQNLSFVIVPLRWPSSCSSTPWGCICGGPVSKCWCCNNYCWPSASHRSSAFLQAEIAFQANVDLLDVSAELLMQVLAEAPAAESESLVAMLARRGQQLGLIRPSRLIRHFDLPVLAAARAHPGSAALATLSTRQERTVRQTPSPSVDAPTPSIFAFFLSFYFNCHQWLKRVPTVLTAITSPGKHVPCKTLQY